LPSLLRNIQVLFSSVTTWASPVNFCFLGSHALYGADSRVDQVAFFSSGKDPRALQPRINIHNPSKPTRGSSSRINDIKDEIADRR
jgi:hypothetical protein